MSKPPGKVKEIRLPYAPRVAFLPFHQRKQRWACLVCHRRGGKTVAVINDLIAAGIQQADPYAYFAPFRSQAKAVAWDYFKFYARPILHRDKLPNEAELKLTLLNGATFQLFGADNADAARGMGFRRVAMDEYGDFRPSVWGNVIRPTLSDRRGSAVFMGTPKGHNQFYDIYREALADPEWFSMTLKASTSGILHPEELKAARKQLSEDQYDQEYECSFDAAILGAFYGKEMRRVDAEGRICDVPHDPDFPVYTAWDIGRTDDTAIWWYQNIANQIRVLDWYAESGGSVEEYIGDEFKPGTITLEVLKRKEERGYQYERHWLPHDARAKTLGSDGKSVIEKLGKHLGLSKMRIVPGLSVQDGIEAARTALGRCWFDNKCNTSSSSGVEALRQYQRQYNEDSKAFVKEPMRNWATHSADAFRMLAIAERRSMPQAFVQPKPFVEQFPSLDQLTLDELWEASERKQGERVRI